jgi:peptidoglycan/xylan/chitin deacetylase (PgdA/CDA1 family)
MIITFDDGHRGNYSLLPIFQKYEAPATIFLCSAIIDTLRHFWFIDAEGLLPVQKLKKLTNRKRIDRLAAIGFEEQKEYATRQALSRQEIEEMRPLIDFQSHTRFHPILTSCEPEQFSEEIIGSKKELEDHLGLRIFALAYPNGDYNNGIVEETRTAGYSCGLTVDHGVNEDITDLYMLRRLDVNDTENLHELAVKASGLWQYIKARCKL